MKTIAIVYLGKTKRFQEEQTMQLLPYKYLSSIGCSTKTRTWCSLTLTGFWTSGRAEENIL